MKAAMITQPRDGIGENTSIGIIALSLARPLSRLCDVIVFGKKNPRLPKLTDTSPQLQYEYVSVAADDYFIKPLMKILLRLTSGRKHMPAFAMQAYYLAYITLISIKIRSRKCDVIHIHNYTQFIPVARFFNPKAKIIIQMNCEWLTQLDRNIMHKRLQKADLILSCSSYITLKNREAFPEIAERFETFYNGVDTRKFSPENKGVQQKGKKTILFIGRVSPEKGVHILIEAFSAAARKFNDIDLVITGHKSTSDFISELDDDEIVRGLLPFYAGKNYIDHLDSITVPELKRRITYTGAVDHDKLMELYSSAFMFIFPSVWHEPFGIPVIEAMACGIPVIGARSGGIAEIIHNRKNGILVERSNAEDLRRGIEEIITNDDLRQRLQTEGPRHAEEIFSWDRLACRLFEFYTSPNKH